MRASVTSPRSIVFALCVAEWFVEKTSPLESWVMSRAGFQPTRRRWLAACLAAVLLTAPLAADEPPLHQRIDALAESTSLAARAPLADDATFLRRVYLDLNGTIPDAATARAFLDDASPDKRAALIERLLARPEFARHLARVFDIMLMERRADKHALAAEWHEYLRASIAAGKPLDQLAREILSADGADPALRPAARFYLDRDGDANLVTRDVGRLFLGRDMQCAQCHDHPLVSDYVQGDYYGLLAFVNRGVLFLDEKAKKSYYAEKADGEVNYKSVFTGDARDHVIPKLPDVAATTEPALRPEEQYVVAPAKDVRPVPKFSRRAQLAAAIASGTSSEFRRNLANRLWAYLMGRGLVHPLDMQHSANPAVQSQLLDLLANSLAAMKYDLKSFVRELALSRAYQRSSESAADGMSDADAATVGSNLSTWKAELEKLVGELKPLEEANNQAQSAMSAAYEAYSKQATARDAAQKVHGEAKKASDDVSAVLAKAIKDVTAKEEALKAILEAREKARAVAARLPDDKPLADAAALFNTRANEVDTQLAEVRKTVSEKTPLVQAAAVKLGEAEAAWQSAGAAVSTAKTALDAADGAARAAGEKFRAAKARHRELESAIADAQSLSNYHALVAAASQSRAAAQAAADQLAALQSQSATGEPLTTAESAAAAATGKANEDQAAAHKAREALVERSTVRFTLGGLRALSPEQLAFATMQALGVADAERAALLPQVTKDLDAMANLAPADRDREQPKLLEARTDEKLRAHIGPFVSLFGQQPGQAAEFNSTVHQALFFANGGLLAGWLNPGGNNLTERLSKIEAPATAADELYLTVLTRRPTAEEQAAVAAYWEAAKADRPAAARELAWSLVTSAEFRFNH